MKNKLNKKSINDISQPKEKTYKLKFKGIFNSDDIDSSKEYAIHNNIFFEYDSKNSQMIFIWNKDAIKEAKEILLQNDPMEDIEDDLEIDRTNMTLNDLWEKIQSLIEKISDHSTISDIEYEYLNNEWYSIVNNWHTISLMKVLENWEMKEITSLPYFTVWNPSKEDWEKLDNDLYKNFWQTEEESYF